MAGCIFKFTLNNNFPSDLKWVIGSRDDNGKSTKNLLKRLEYISPLKFYDVYYFIDDTAYEGYIFLSFHKRRKDCPIDYMDCVNKLIDAQVITHILNNEMGDPAIYETSFIEELLHNIAEYNCKIKFPKITVDTKVMLREGRYKDMVGEVTKAIDGVITIKYNLGDGFEIDHIVDLRNVDIEIIKL